MEFIEKTLSQVLREKTQAHPDHDFLVYSDRSLHFTYSQFDKRVDDLAKGFLAMGVKKGDHVGIWATNVPDWNTTLFACARIGAVLVTINTGYKTHELEYVLKQSDMVCLCLTNGWRDSDYIGMVNELVPDVYCMFTTSLVSSVFSISRNRAISVCWPKSRTSLKLYMPRCFCWPTWTTYFKKGNFSELTKPLCEVFNSGTSSFTMPI
jgi:Acyl-CoA synthetases (AMP-forming)/AMP-acid ligases II